MSDDRSSLTLFSPAGVLRSAAPLRRAAKRLGALGFDGRDRRGGAGAHQRFAGDDDDAPRRAAPRRRRARRSIALATRGGYGLTRLLDRIDWKRIAQQRRARHALGRQQRPDRRCSSACSRTPAAASPGPGRSPATTSAAATAEGGVDDVTAGLLRRGDGGELEAVGFRTEAGFDGLGVRGTLWGGNLCVRQLAARHAALAARQGRHPVPRGRQRAPVPHRAQPAAAAPGRRARRAEGGRCSAPSATGRKSPLDRGYTLKTVVAQLRAATQDADPHRPAVRPRADQGDAAGRRARAAAGRRARRADRLVSAPRWQHGRQAAAAR